MFDLAVPVLSIGNAADARAFYCDLLGFEVTFEHQFAEGLPLYLGLHRDKARLHLSEHANDGTAPGVVRFEMTGLRDFHASLQGIHMPTVEDKPWGYAELVLEDPFGNRLIFVEEI